jgi:hypothetical protein
MNSGSPVYRSGSTAISCTAPVTHYAADSPSHLGSPTPPFWPRGKSRRLLWGVAGTLLSALGFVLLAGFEQYSGMLSELRGDLKHFYETSGDYVKKDSLQRIRDQVRDCLKEMHLSNAARAQVEQELRASEKARTDLANELQRFRERLAYIEGRQTATPTMAAAPAKKQP